MQSSTRPRTRLTQVSVRFEIAFLVSPQLPIPLAAIPAAQTAGFDSTWLVFTGLPLSCVHGAVTSTLKSHLDLTDPFFVSSSPDSTVIQQCSC